jgi:hypothetical protein
VELIDVNRRPLSHLVRNERGIALPMALGVMMVLTIALVAVLQLSSSGQLSSKRSAGEDRSVALAEAGVEHATSLLTRATDVINPSAVAPGSEQVSEGTLGWSTSLSGLTWTITGTGTVANPDAGTALVRRVTRQISVSTQDSPWHYLFADQQSGCMIVKNNATISAPLYVRGNLCVSNNAHLTGSPVQVTGTLTVGSNGSVGYAATPIAQANLAGGCTGGVPNPHPCTSADSVYATVLNQNVTAYTKPPVDLQRWYQDAKPGPMHNCTVGSMPGGFDNDAAAGVPPNPNRSRADFNLTSGAAYNCEYWEGSPSTLVGRLTWSPSTNTLTVFGTIFFDGTVALSGNVVYQGRATIYSSKIITTANSTTLCGIAGCTGSWNPLQNLLLFVAGSSTAPYGLELNNGVTVQFASYLVTDYHIDNNATNWGPVIARGIQIDNNAGNTISLGALPPGAPGMDGTLHPVPGSWRG